MQEENEKKKNKNKSLAHFSAIFKYASVGVSKSAGTEAVMGTRLGGCGAPFDWERTSLTVSIDG